MALTSSHFTSGFKEHISDVGVSAAESAEHSRGIPDSLVGELVVAVGIMSQLGSLSNFCAVLRRVSRVGGLHHDIDSSLQGRVRS